MVFGVNGDRQSFPLLLILRILVELDEIAYTKKYNSGKPMPAKDIFHAVVRSALEKEGWVITHDPLSVSKSRRG